MTVILVLAMFVTFFVVESFTHRPASEYGVQTAPRPRAVAHGAQSIVESYDVPEIDRPQAERRDRGSQSAA